VNVHRAIHTHAEAASNATAQGVPSRNLPASATLSFHTRHCLVVDAPPDLRRTGVYSRKEILMPASKSPIANVTRASIAAALASLALAMGAHAEPPVIYVDDSAPAGGDGSSWDLAFNDLQDALERSTGYIDGVIIRVGQGTYYPDRGTLDRGASFKVPPTHGASATTLSLVDGYAGFGAADPNAFNPAAFVTVLSGDLKHNDKAGFANRSDNARTVVLFQPFGRLDVDLRGFTIAGARADPLELWSGGIVTPLRGEDYGRGLYLRDCVVADSEPSADSAAIATDRRDLQIYNCTVTNNRGRGVFADDGHTFVSIPKYRTIQERAMKWPGTELSACTTH